jgi:hypothetical protein
MQQQFGNATGWIVSRPLLTLILLATVTAFSCVGHFSPDLIWDLFRQSKSVERIESLDTEARPDVDSFQLQSHVVLVAQSDRFFSPDGVAALRSVVAELEKQD